MLLWLRGPEAGRPSDVPAGDRRVREEGSRKGHSCGTPHDTPHDTQTQLLIGGTTTRRSGGWLGRGGEVQRGESAQGMPPPRFHDPRNSQPG